MFPETRYSAVVLAGSDDPTERARSMERLSNAYYRPIYAHLRLKWRVDPAEAEDLAQGFFQAILERNVFAAYKNERGRFRTFVRTCLDHYVESERRHARRLKRGGGAAPIPIDAQGIEAELVDSGGDAGDPFDREFVRGLFAAAIAELERRLEAAGKGRYFEVFKRYDLATDARPVYSEIARDLGISTTDVTNYLHFARKELKRAVITELRALTTGEEDLREEAVALGIDLDLLK